MQGEVIMINLIEKLLKNNKEISSYKIIERNVISNELYFVHKNIETVRNVATTEYSVTLYIMHDGFIGDASFKVFKSQTEEEIEEKINNTILNAKEVSNKVYSLESDIKSNDEIESNFKEYNLKDIAEKISEAAFKADNITNASINALEIFVKKITRRIVTSTNIDRKEVSYEAMVEAIPTWTIGNDSVELYKQYNFSNLNLDDITLKINEALMEVKARFEAKKPEEEINCPIAIRGLEQQTLLNEIASQLSYASVYQKANIIKIGDDLNPSNKCDKLTLTMASEIKGGSNNHKFDSDGSSLLTTKLIDNGKVISYFGGVKYATYTNMKNTGALSNIKVECGNTSIKDFKLPYFELVSLSGLQVDMYNDYVGGEIRLGYLHTKDGIKPITGVSFQTSIKSLFDNLVLSKEEEVYEGYLGPKLLMFNNAKVL